MATTKKKAPAKAAPKKTVVAKKAAPAKAAPKKAAPAKKSPAVKASPKKIETKKAQRISDDERMQMIATAAYFKAEQRGFIGGDPEQDWAEAEYEVSKLLSK